VAVGEIGLDPEPPLAAFVYTLYLFTAATLTWLCAQSYRRREKAAGVYLFRWMLLGLLYNVGVVICANLWTPLWLYEVSAHVRMASIALVPVFMLAFALDYAERGDALESWWFKALYVLPACSILLLLSPWREFFYVCRPELLPYGLNNTRLGHGPWFLVHSAYCLLLIVVAGVVLLSYWARSTGYYRRQAGLLLTGYTFPVVGMMLTAFGPKSWPSVDYSLLTFPITAACWYVALYQYKLLDVAPVARRRAVELMRDAVVVLDPARRVVDLNPSALALARVDAIEGAVGTPIAGLLAGVEDRLEPVFDAGSPDVSLTLETARGRRVYDVSYTPLEDGRGGAREVGGLLVFRDVTENARLIEELDAYARTVAHDLKNPLSGLRGYLEILEEDVAELEGVQEDTLEVVQRAQGITDKMVEIVHELLLMAHIRSDTDIPTGEIDMGLIVGQIELRMSSQLAGVAFNAPREWPRVTGYAPWLEEVWANYVSNALKYGGDPPTVTLGVDEEGEEARFWVQDNGDGMTQEQAATVFDEYTRLEQHQGVSGHGVGLAVVRRVVERQGGRAGVESVPGEGSRFWFTLPRVVE
jgi:signal transduction histidine kinase